MNSLHNSARRSLDSTFICPSPLVYFNSTPENTQTFAAYSNCAAPCPSLDYDDSQWKVLTSVLLYVSGIACFLSVAAFLAHVSQFKRYYIRVMFIGGFLINSLLMFSFQLLNEENKIVCDGPAHFIPKGSFCVLTAACQIFGLIWSHTWSVIMAYDTYLHVTLQHRSQDATKLRLTYGLVGFSIPSVFTLLPLCFGILGFDHQANIPICFFLVSNYKWVFWASFVGPFYVLLTVSLLFTFATARRIHQVFISSGHYQNDYQLLPKLRKEVDIPFLLSYENGVESEPSQNSSDLEVSQHLERVAIPLSADTASSVGEVLNDLVRRQQRQISSAPSSVSGSNRGSEYGTAPNMDELGFVYMSPPNPSSPHRSGAKSSSNSPARSSGRGGIGSQELTPGEKSSVKPDADESEALDVVGELPSTVSAVSSSSNLSALPPLAGSRSKLDHPASISDQNSYSLYSSTNLRDSLLEENDTYRNEYGEYSDYEFYDTDDENGTSGSRSGYRVNDSKLGSQKWGSTNAVNAALLGATAGRSGPNDGARDNQYHSLAWLLSPNKDGSRYRVRSSSNDGWSCCSLLTSCWYAVQECLVFLVATITCGYCCSGLPKDILLLTSAVWHYNGRAILFVIVCGMTTFSLLPMTLKLFYFEFNDYVESGEEFVNCLVHASMDCIDQTQQGVDQCAMFTCGDRPKIIPNLSIMCTIMAWNAGYGIAPSLIFGFLGFTKPITDLFTHSLCPTYASRHPSKVDTALN